MGGARKGKGKGEEPPRPSLSICLRKHKAGPNNFIRFWNIYGQLKGDISANPISIDATSAGFEEREHCSPLPTHVKTHSVMLGVKKK